VASAIFVLGGVLGTGFGVALGFFMFPFVFPPPAASEQLAEADRTLPVARGTSFTPIRPNRCITAKAR
jgi:hypothetical protein